MDLDRTRNNKGVFVAVVGIVIVYSVLIRASQSRTSTKSSGASLGGESSYVQTAKGIILWTIPFFLLALTFWLIGDEKAYWQMFSAIIVFLALVGSALLNWRLHQEREKHDFKVERLLKDISAKL